MVAEASRNGRIVAAHCHGKASILAALRAGCATIEHGTYLDEERIRLMKEKGAMLIGTRTFFDSGLQVKHLWTPESYAKLQKAAVIYKAAFGMAVKSGIKVALGTDLGVSGEVDDDLKVFGHGSNGNELVYMVEAGMSPLEVIEAATANGPDTLGPEMAPASGQIKEGFDADLIAINADPIKDMSLLANAGNVTHVWRQGRAFKEPRENSNFS